MIPNYMEGQCRLLFHPLLCRLLPFTGSYLNAFLLIRSYCRYLDLVDSTSHTQFRAPFSRVIAPSVQTSIYAPHVVHLASST